MIWLSHEKMLIFIWKSVSTFSPFGIKSHAFFIDNSCHGKVMHYSCTIKVIQKSCQTILNTKIHPAFFPKCREFYQKKSGQNTNLPWILYHFTHELWEKSLGCDTKVMPILQWILDHFHMTSCWSGIDILYFIHPRWAKRSGGGLLWDDHNFSTRLKAEKCPWTHFLQTLLLLSWQPWNDNNKTRNFSLVK